MDLWTANLWDLETVTFSFYYVKFCHFIDNVHPRTDHEVSGGEQTYSSTLSLTSALARSEWSSQAPPLYPRKETQYTFYRRLGGPRVGLDGCGKSRLPQNSIHCHVTPVICFHAHFLCQWSEGLGRYPSCGEVLHHITSYTTWAKLFKINPTLLNFPPAYEFRKCDENRI
jgi:hypothetical protein